VPSLFFNFLLSSLVVHFLAKKSDSLRVLTPDAAAAVDFLAVDCAGVPFEEALVT